MSSIILNRWGFCDTTTLATTDWSRLRDIATMTAMIGFGQPGEVQAALWFNSSYQILNVSSPKHVSDPSKPRL